MSSSVGVEMDRVAAADRVDPGCVRGEGDVEDAGVGRGLGEGGVVAARAADERAAGATAAGGQQVAVGFAVEEGRPGPAADQAVGAGAAVELVGAVAGLDQVVLVATANRVVAEAAGDADVLRPRQRAFDREAVAAGAEVGHHPAGRAFGRAARLHGADPGAARAERDPLLAAVTPKVENASLKATTKWSRPPPPTSCSPPPPPETGSSST